MLVTTVMVSAPFLTFGSGPVGFPTFVFPVVTCGRRGAHSPLVRARAMLIPVQWFKRQKSCYKSSLIPFHDSAPCKCTVGCTNHQTAGFVHHSLQKGGGYVSACWRRPLVLHDPLGEGRFVRMLKASICSRYKLFWLPRCVGIRFIVASCFGLRSTSLVTSHPSECCRLSMPVLVVSIPGQGHTMFDLTDMPARLNAALHPMAYMSPMPGHVAARLSSLRCKCHKHRCSMRTTMVFQIGWR